LYYQWVAANATHYEENGGRWGVLTNSQLQTIITTAHALMAAGNNKAAQALLKSFSSTGGDGLC